MGERKEGRTILSWVEWYTGTVCVCSWKRAREPTFRTLGPGPVTKRAAKLHQFISKGGLSTYTVCEVGQPAKVDICCRGQHKLVGLAEDSK